MLQIDGSGTGAEPLKIIDWQRRGDVLTRPKLPCLGAFHTVNLSAGCPNRCRYCYAQSYAHHPGWGTVAFYANARDKMRSELSRLRNAPRLVYFSTASDPFVPAERLLNDLYDIMSMLLECGAALLISTKCRIPDRFVDLFARKPGKVHVQVGITTVDDDARCVIEPGAAPVEARLDNLRRLNVQSIGCEARADPLVPGLTDTNESMRMLVSALADTHVRIIVASFLFLRRGIQFPENLSYNGWSPRKMRSLYTHKVTDYCGGGTIWLPGTAYRREKFEILNAMASKCGIRMIVCHCKNTDAPDSSCCHPADLVNASSNTDRQLTLF